MNYSILSYNLLWKSMINVSTRNNIIHNIKYFSKKFNSHFILLQEASNYQFILNSLPSHYTYYYNHSDKDEMLTLWNNKIYNVLYATHSHFSPGRPFAIILLQIIKTKKNIILINIHAGHDNNSQINIFDKINAVIHKNKFIFKNISKVILGGDFNRNIYLDHTSNYTIIINNKSFPLKINDKFNNINKNTCCNLNNSQLNHNSDHVISSNKISNKILLHTFKNYKFPASDHIPIISIL